MIVLLTILIVLGVVAYLNRDNIKAFLMAYSSSQESLQGKLEATSSIDSELLSQYVDIPLRELTEDEKQKLASSEITEEDAVALILGSLGNSGSADSSHNESVVTDTPVHTPSDEQSAEDAPGGEPENIPGNNTEENAEKDIVVPDVNQPAVSDGQPSGETTKTPPSEPDKTQETKAPDNVGEDEKKIAELVAKLYVTKAQVNTKLDAYIEELRAEYVADKTLTKEERHATKSQFAARAIKVVAKWEKECDAEVNAIFSELEAVLKKMGKGNELVETIRTAYQEEKAVKKAYLINRYMD
ncbi:MAG: hypothetical protein IJO74_03770 [Clostridia bacterium]|nr:hypothetical protein [Clostridia bacterium]